MAEPAGATDSPGETPAVPGPKAKKRLMDLPIEIQKNIFQHSTSSDLIALSLVSRHFHPLACAQLYRTFSIVFPDEDDPAFDSPIDGLAGGLDTMVTSQHDYAQYLREISLDSLSGGVRGEKSYKYYSYAESCGKFMNTLLVLTMRRAKALESFHWNIRVELSRPLYHALHNIHTLKHLHIRLQAGPSLYMAPPALPSQCNATQDTPVLTPLSIFSSFAVPHIPPPPYASKPPKLPPPESKEKRKDPPTISGFKSLQSLAVLDMDSLDYLSEIATCVRSSSSTLKKLKLSLSEPLAMRARKPVLDDSDESDQEIDEFGQLIIQPAPNMPPPPLPEGSQEKEAKIRAERSNQEAVLGKIFGLEKVTTDNKKVSAKDTGEKHAKSEEVKQAARTEKARKALEDGLKAATVAFLEASKPPNNSAPKLDAGTLKSMSEAFSKLLSERVSEAASGQASSSSKPAPGGVISSEEAVVEGKGKGKEVAFDLVEPPKVDNAGPENARNLKDQPKSVETVELVNGIMIELNSGKSSSVPAGEGELFDEKAPSEPRTNAQPVDSELAGIDLEHPDTVDEDDVEDQDTTEEATDAEENRTEPDQCANNGERPSATSSAASETQASLPASAGHTSVAGPSTDPVGATATATMSGGLCPPSKLLDEKAGELSSPPEEALKDYVRSTRKLPLHTLSLYLIPIKASVLTRAVDLSTLRRITLLNVGPQAPFWTTMSNLNRSHPLSLDYIHTDNVSPKFLSLVSSLPRLTEIYLLERSSGAKVESLSGKTTVGIEEIRRQVLKPHLKTLKKVMIKNDDNYAWDIDVKAMRLITKRGKGLVELAISMGLRSFHLLLQYLPGLAKLRALHIVSFHTDDTCAWVMRELRKFAIDNVAHHPNMKLEYIGLDHTVERLLRKPKEAKKPKSQAHNSAPKMAANEVKSSISTSSVSCSNTSNGASGPGDVGLPSGNNHAGSSSDQPQTNGISSLATNGVLGDETSSSDGSEDEDIQPLLKIETLDNVKLYDVYGVRIFRKDVVGGRL